MTKTRQLTLNLFVYAGSALREHFRLPRPDSLYCERQRATA